MPNRDFTEKEMPGWDTPMMRQAHDEGEFFSVWKIHKNLEHVKAMLKPEDTLLDVGCYLGHLYGHLGHQNYTGVDLFPEHISVAKEKYPEAKFECVDLFDLDGKWDVVVCCRVLMHVPNFEKAVRKLISISRRKCILIIPIRDEDAISCDSDGVYFRVFSQGTVEKIAPCEVITGARYSTVIYG